MAEFAVRLTHPAVRDLQLLSDIIDGDTITVMRVIDRKDLQRAIKRLQS